ncbi:3-oxoacyl-ACP reductase [Enterococcus faecalis]|uniref:3-oxoacyl-ACP reductase n=1 Tax=Enterococcus faecalis TaxID=1351 RepID=UPI003F5DF91A
MFKGVFLMPKEFETKRVLVTGAASGIGQAQAIAFAEQGAEVIGIDLDETGLKQTAALVNPDSTKPFTYFVGDVSSPSFVQATMKQIVKDNGQIDILLNTAGILDDYRPSLETSEALWDQILATNLKSVFLVTNALLPYFLQQKKGVIVNMASIAGLVAGGGGAAYTASKHAIIGYTKQLSYDYAKLGIRANAIAPGAIQTPMNAADFAGEGEMVTWVASETPAGRWAQPQEVAKLSLFLASDDADYIHGTVMTIDGGWTMK